MATRNTSSSDALLDRSPACLPAIGPPQPLPHSHLLNLVVIQESVVFTTSSLKPAYDWSPERLKGKLNISIHPLLPPAVGRRAFWEIEFT